MPEVWTGELIGKMHNNGVTYSDLADELGCGKSYISMVLNGKRFPQGAEKRFFSAFDRIIEKRNQINKSD